MTKMPVPPIRTSESLTLGRVTDAWSKPVLAYATEHPDHATEHPAAAAHETIRRRFGLMSVFAVAFAFISPIIALYAIFDLGLGIAGPSFWWAFAVVLVGQLLVALVFGELSSRWPEEGGVYAWAGRLVGTRFAWCTGWVYIWTLLTLNSAAAFAASTFAAALCGIDNPNTTTRLAFALAFIVAATAVNLVGRRLLEIFVVMSVICEVIGSLVVGTVLLLVHRNNDISVIFSGFSDGGAAYAAGPFLAAVAVVGWALIGFESAGDLAAEVTEPERNVPIAQIASLVLVAATVMYAGLALVLAVPDLDAVANGAVGDAILETIATNLGSNVVVPLTVVVCIGFTAGIAAVCTALSRSVHAMAAFRSLPLSPILVRRSITDDVPRPALVLTSLLACLLLALAVSTGFYDVMISMSTGGFYIAFLFPVAAALITRLRGQWSRGRFSLGRTAGVIVNTAAAVWLVAEIVNISWPRAIGQPWYIEWGCLLMYLCTGLLGAVVFRQRREHISKGHYDDV
ncbi:hypothetical protein CH289_04555 [Rhodococcus sp. RS1C4]|nr:hypothetical protein CH289_04555 [Rhodococcus sp. RS1C4]